MTSSYSSIEFAKNNQKIAIFSDGKSFYSKYNPRRDAENFAHAEALANADFICIGGIANGYHLDELRNLYPEKFIVAFEDNEISLDFLKKNADLSRFADDSKIILTSLENLEQELLTHYLPALYKNFCFTCVRSWEDFHNEQKKQIQKAIKEALDKISADYSVQTRFGKIWQKNIIYNSNYCNGQKYIHKITKTACIVAAGPSLDKSIDFIKKNLNQLTIIATDTTLPTLLSNQIFPEFVVSIDAQIFSHEHFVCNLSKLYEKTTFLMDICADSSTVRKLSRKNAKIIFFKSGHPLANYCEEKSSSTFMTLSTGRGTVTSACFSFCEYCNFKECIFIGADFSYQDYKPYCKGTYLEKKFVNCSNRLNSIENQYDNLMYRTELIENGDGFYTTKLLSEYKEIQSQMSEKSSIKVLKYDKSVIINTKYDNKLDIKYDINYDKIIELSNPDINPNVFNKIDDDYALLPYKAWLNSKQILQ
ncbi:MAG: DUF115 domain-containing protein [Spirochaetales bacterium]|nr:DUF115 domain-containing protein [Spirochaetales bacterium]